MKNLRQILFKDVPLRGRFRLNGVEYTKTGDTEAENNFHEPFSFDPNDIVYVD